MRLGLGLGLGLGLAGWGSRVRGRVRGRVRACTGVPERVMMKREDDLLHTSSCSGLSGMKATCAGAVAR